MNLVVYVPFILGTSFSSLTCTVIYQIFTGQYLLLVGQRKEHNPQESCSPGRRVGSEMGILIAGMWLVYLGHSTQALEKHWRSARELGVVSQDGISTGSKD